MVVSSIPALHVGATSAVALTSWHLEPGLTILLLLAAASYLFARRAAARARRRLPSRWRLLAFLAGIGTIALAFLGPLDHGASVRFSRHMLQHTLLILVAAPLLALGQPVRTLVRGLPSSTLRWLAGHRGVARLGRLARHPIIAFVAVTVPFALWHYPPLYDAAVRDAGVHALEHATFLGGAFLFWSVLLDPFPGQRRLGPSATILLLFAVWMATDLVCATVTLAPHPLYSVYVDVTRSAGVDPLTDQRLGGAIMWGTGGVLYAVVLLSFLVRSARRIGAARERVAGAS